MALVAAVILLLLSAVLVNLLFLSSYNAQREAEINRGRWFLEGRVEEYFDSIISGKTAFSLGRFDFQEVIDGKDQHFTLEVYRNKEEKFSLHAYLKWKDRYKIEQYLEFSRLNLFDYALYVNGDLNIELKKNIAIAGNLGLTGRFSAAGSGRLYLFWPNYFTPRVDYASSAPAIRPYFFGSDPLGLLANVEGDFKADPLKTSLSFHKIEKLTFPAFENMWQGFYRYRDDSWVVQNYFLGQFEWIQNPMDTEKTLVAIGDGYSTRFDCPSEISKSWNVQNVYIKKITSAAKFQNIDSLDYAYCYGVENKNKFFSFNRGIIDLKASGSPAFLLLPEDGYTSLGVFQFGGKGWSFISFDEKIEQIYLNRPSYINALLSGVDYHYTAVSKSLKIMTEKFYADYTAFVGEGNGSRVEFPCGYFPQNTCCYIGGRRTAAFSIQETKMVFSSPPPDGKEIRTMRLPNIYLKKAPPSERTGIFIDKMEKAAVLDLSAIQNPPANGVIISYLPLLVRGESSFPLAIVSRENIYLENINPQNKGEPVCFVSKRGVWIYRKSGRKESKINKCFIYSPLKGLFTLNENGEIGGSPASIYGSVILSFENEKGAMDYGLFENHFIYYAGITNYLTQKPFSLFPLPLKIKMVRRS